MPAATGSKTVFAIAFDASSPPIKKVIWPSAMLATPPAIAASTNPTPYAEVRLAQSIAVCGVTVLVSIISFGRLSRSSNWPVTASEMSGCGNDMIATSIAAVKAPNWSCVKMPPCEAEVRLSPLRSYPCTGDNLANADATA